MIDPLPCRKPTCVDSLARRRNHGWLTRGCRGLARACRKATPLLALFASCIVLADPVELTILQTTDIHGFVTRSSAYRDGGGGWLRLATLIGRQREKHGEDGILLIDCGDTVNGTLEALPSWGELAVDLLKYLRYDVWVPGNHELDFGVAQCARLCALAGEMVVCGNLRLRLAPAAEEIVFPAWRMFERRGLRVAVIGMTASYSENWFWAVGEESFATPPAVDGIAAVIGEIRMAAPHFIILATHQGWLPNDPRQVNEVIAIAERFPEIDLILGGHTHWAHAGRRIGRNTWYVQSGRHADALAVVRATFDRQTGDVLNLESELLKADLTIPIDPAAAAAVSHHLTTADKLAKKVVGQLAEPLPSGTIPGINSAASELLSRAIAEATGVEVVVHGKLSNKSFPAGDFTESDLFDLVPYENEVGVLTLPPEILAAILEEQIVNRKSYAVNGLWGLRATVSADNRVVALRRPDGGELSEPVCVAFNSYSLAGGGGRFPVLRQAAVNPAYKPSRTSLSTRDVVRDYLAANRPVSVEIVNWFEPRMNADERR